MAIRAIISVITVTTLLLALLGTGPGCANIVPPSGGPPDTLPPVLLKVTPPDSMRNFMENRITFTFDEYVDLDNYQQNLIVSPYPKNTPNVSRKLQTITVKLRDSLEANTTYTLNFGEAIKDVNEGNIMRDFTYTFTTGDYFDSLQLRGNILVAQTGEIDTTVTVLLHRTGEDSAMVKQRPRYITRVDGKGNFVFKNMPPGTYYMYALKDESGSYRYFNNTQLFGFADSSVVISRESKPVTLYVYSVPAPAKASDEEGVNKRKGADKRIRFTANLQNNEQDLLKPFVLKFETPLRTFDSSKLSLSTDTTYTPVTNYRWTLDSTRKELTLNHVWKENTVYNLLFVKDFATDTLGQQLLKDDTLMFNTRRIIDYGKLAIRFINLDLTRNLVLQFVQNNEIRASFPLTAATFNQALFVPGEYNLRILYDDNKNGVWDPGQFFGKRLQPESVKPVSRVVTIKANYDNQFEIDVNAIANPAGQQNRIGPGRQDPGTPARQPGRLLRNTTPPSGQ